MIQIFKKHSRKLTLVNIYYCLGFDRVKGFSYEKMIKQSEMGERRKGRTEKIACI